MKKIINKLYLDSIEYIVNWKKHSKEYLWAIIIVLIIRSFLGVVYRIPTASMIPTFRQGDILIGNRFYYGLKLPFADEKTGYRLPAVREPEIGDVIIINGPREEVFYDLIVDISERNYPLLAQLNEESKFKGIIDLNSYFFLDNEKNYIVIDTLDRKAILHLHESVYEGNQESIKENFNIYSSEKKTFVMNYAFSKEKPWYKRYLSTPIAGASIIGTVLVNSPFFLVYEIVFRLLSDDFVKPVNFYPNKYIDNTKEYVKRYIAGPGDKVEIRSKVLYVNDQRINRTKEYRVDPYIDTFKIYQEPLPYSAKSRPNQTFTHPLRLGEDLITPGEEFSSQDWPFEPEVYYTVNFRDSFGPVIVPEDHLFVLGDNRDESLDSRFIGAVPKWAIKGSPYFIFFPWDRKGVVK